MVGNERSPPHLSGVRLGGATLRHHPPRHTRHPFACRIAWRSRFHAVWLGAARTHCVQVLPTVRAPSSFPILPRGSCH